MKARNNQHAHRVGVKYVRERLIEQGYWVIPTTPEIKTLDLVAMSRDGSTTGVKVRVNTSGNRSWRMKDWSEGSTGENLVVCLVSIDEDIDDEPHDVYIVPSTIVAHHIRIAHAEWLMVPKANGDRHRDSDSRALVDPVPESIKHVMGRYPDGWLDRHKEAWATSNPRIIGAGCSGTPPPLG